MKNPIPGAGQTVPPYLIVPVRQSGFNKLCETTDDLCGESGTIAFESWEEAASYFHKKWRKKIRFIILNGIGIFDDGVPIVKEGSIYRISGRLPRSYALNLSGRTKRQISSGGVVRCSSSRGVSLLLIQYDRNGALRWEIPKGKIMRKESIRQAAIREVREETGIEVDLRMGGRIGEVDYIFQGDEKVMIYKTVHYYLLEADQEGDVTPRREEGITDVRWFPADNAREIVSFPNLKPILRLAATSQSP